MDWEDDELRAIAHYLTAHALAGYKLELTVTEQRTLVLEARDIKFARDEELYDYALELLNARGHALAAK